MSIVSVEKDVDALSFVLVAEFDAPIGRVWELWADPRKLERWWGPPGYPATVSKHDLRPGGELTYSMSGPGGETSRGLVAGDVVRPADVSRLHGRIRQRRRNTELGAADARGAGATFREEAGTRMELRFVFESREQMEQMEGLGAFEGIPQSVGQMDDVLAQA